jgi:hypothetical protein
MADAESVETTEIRFDDDEDVMMNKTGGYI